MIKKCRKCQIQLNKDNTYESDLDVSNYICKKCKKKQYREDYKNNKNECRTNKREYYYKNKKRENIKSRKYYQENRKSVLEVDKKNKHNKKMMVYTHYGGNPPKCACCGETELVFLSIDHINGGGSKHRRKVGSGYLLYYWLINNNYPEGFQILCRNCNWAKSHGGCPHKMYERKVS